MFKMPLTEQQLIERLYSVAIFGSSSELLLLLGNIADPCVTIENGRYKDCSAIDLALINGKIENAKCLFENVEAFQSDESLSVCYYHVITKVLLRYQVLALEWLKAKSSNPNTAHSDDVYRPVHTAIQVRNNVVLLILLAGLRFNLCLTGNYHEPYGCLTPLQLALLYDNEQVARHLLCMENGLEILCAKSSNELDAIQFAKEIGKLDILRQWILESYPSVNQNSDELNNLMSRLNLVDSRCTDSDTQIGYTPSFSFC